MKPIEFEYKAHIGESFIQVTASIPAVRLWGFAMETRIKDEPVDDDLIHELRKRAMKDLLATLKAAHDAWEEMQ